MHDFAVSTLYSTHFHPFRCALAHENSFVIRACQKLTAHSQEAGQAATCFSNKAQRMAYDLYRRPGNMIGSGAVESGC